MIKSSSISKAIEEEKQRANEPVGKPPVQTKEMAIDSLPTKPIETIESETPEIIPSDKSGDSTSYVTLNVGGSASAPLSQESTKENENRKKYIQYGVILFIVLFLMLIVMNLKKNK